MLLLQSLLHTAEPDFTRSIKVELTNLIQNDSTSLLTALFYTAHGNPEDAFITTGNGERKLSEDEMNFIKRHLIMTFARPIDPATGERFFDFLTRFSLKSK